MKQHSQRGVVLIMVLWTAIVLTVLVTVLAANIRLSANTALHHRTGTQAHAQLMGAVRKAEMELMMELLKNLNHCKSFVVCHRWLASDLM